jgi:hypothetical protein
VPLRQQLPPHRLHAHQVARRLLDVRPRSHGHGWLAARKRRPRDGEHRVECAICSRRADLVLRQDLAIIRLRRRYDLLFVRVVGAVLILRPSLLRIACALVGRRDAAGEQGLFCLLTSDYCELRCGGGVTWYSNVRSPALASFACMVSAMCVVISSSSRKCTSRLVGCTFTSTVLGSSWRLKMMQRKHMHPLQTRRNAPEIDKRRSAFGQDTRVHGFRRPFYPARLDEPVCL